jgi:hypothetical protein
VGAGNPGGARRSFVLAVQLAMTVSATWAVLFVAIPACCSRHSISRARCTRRQSAFLAISAAFQVFDAMAEVAEGTLAGAGATRWVLATGFVESWLVRLPLSPSSPRGSARVEGVWGGLAIGIALRGLVGSARVWWGARPVEFRRVRWGRRARLDSAGPVAPSPSGYGNTMDHRPPDHFDEVLRQVEDALDNLRLADGPKRDALLNGVREALENSVPDGLGVIELEATLSDLDGAPSVRVVDGGRDPEGPPSPGSKPDLRVADPGATEAPSAPPGVSDSLGFDAQLTERARRPRHASARRGEPGRERDALVADTWQTCVPRDCAAPATGSGATAVPSTSRSTAPSSKSCSPVRPRTSRVRSSA